MYAPESPYVVYCRTCWYSDKWDPTSYGRDYDFSRPFFEQFGELLRVVPRVAILYYGNPVNCTASNSLLDSKNLYMCYSGIFSEDCAYSQNLDQSRSSFDCLDAKELELCYENVDATKNYNSHHLVHTRNCLESSFLYDCSNCQNCFMSSNLRNKQYVFRNKQYNKADYELAIKELNTGTIATIEALRTEFRQMIKGALHKYADINKSSNCTGDMIDSSNSVRQSFNVYNGDNLKYCDRLLPGHKDSYDVMGGRGSELLYEGIICGSGSNTIHFFNSSDQARETDYTDWCMDVSNLFGCVSLRKKKYCILNKQYSQGEYIALHKKIIEHTTQTGEYGEFYPKEISLFAYNETLAQEYDPLTKVEALAKGFRWRDPDTKDYKVTLPTQNLPESIDEIDDNIINETIGCAHEGKCNDGCTTAFRIIPTELSLYRNMRLPIPRLCPNCRHVERLSYRNPFYLWHRQCMCDKAHSHHQGHCSNEFETTYAPDRPEIVYCEQCYQNEVV
jgi:hypothetical protein